MISRLRILCLSFAIMRTIAGCTTLPPKPVTPPLVLLPPATPTAPAPVVPVPSPPPLYVPSPVAPWPSVPPLSPPGTRKSDGLQLSPYERQMEEDELAYRKRRSVQEQEQEQRYQQWQQERARERDPRYEWMR